MNVTFSGCGLKTEVDFMDELGREYKLLFNGITDTIRQLEKTVRRLEHLQRQAEEMLLQEDDDGALQQGEEKPVQK